MTSARKEGRAATPGLDVLTKTCELKMDYVVSEVKKILPDVGNFPAIQPDTRAAIDFLNHWQPEGSWLLTAIEPDPLPTPEGEEPKSSIETKTFNDPELAADWIEGWQGVRNLYFSVNQTNRRMNKKATKADIIVAAGLHVDADPADGEDQFSAKPRLMGKLHALGERPTVIIDSGGGVQGLWKFRVSYPINADNDRDYIEALNRGIEHAVDGDHCFNLDRIMRLPGTINLPNQKKRDKGRVVAASRVVEADWDRLYDVTDFEPAEAIPVAKTNGHATKHAKLNGHAKTTNDEGRDKSRSARALAIGGRVHRAGGSYDDFIEALRTDPTTESWFREQSDHRQFERIWEKVQADAAIPAEMAELNERFSVVSEDGHVMVYEWRHDAMQKRLVLDRISFDDFKKMYLNRFVEVVTKSGPTTVALGTHWLHHPMRRQYLNGVIFDPSGNTPPGCMNLWRGLSVDPKPGDWSLMRQHILEIICSGNEAHYEYMMDLSARMYQHPEMQGEVAVALRGKKGTGKGLFLNALFKPWGQHGCYISNAVHLVGRFNEHYRDCVMLWADEAFFAGDKAHESVLKAIITEPFLPIEGKYKPLVKVPNRLHIWMSSNEEWVVPVSKDERRYFVLDVSDARIGDDAYFDAIIEQMENGGLEAMVYDLLHRDISGFKHRKVPKTKALAEQQELSRDTLDKWWAEVLDRGYVWESPHGIAEFGDWIEFGTVQLLGASYQQWCRANSVRRPMSADALAKRFTDIYGKGERRNNQIVGEIDRPQSNWLKSELIKRVKAQQRGYVLGPLDVARRQFAAIRKIKFDGADSQNGGEADEGAGDEASKPASRRTRF